jgi:hypothetical protein
MRVFLLLVALSLPLAAYSTLLDVVNCDTNITVGDQLAPEITGTVTHNEVSIPFLFSLTSTDLLAEVYLDILTASVEVSARDAAGIYVGLNYTWAQLLLKPGLIKVKPDNFPGCITTPGCNGYTLDTVRLIQLFPITAVLYTFTNQLQWSKNASTIIATSTSRRILGNTPGSAEVIGQSDLVTTDLSFAQPWRNIAFQTPGEACDTNCKITFGIIGGVVGLLFILFCGCLFYKNATNYNSGRSVEERKPLTDYPSQFGGRFKNGMHSRAPMYRGGVEGGY